jgi:hypothetical protein
MRRVAIVDSVTTEVQATVTCIAGTVTIEGEGLRRKSWEQGVPFCGRNVVPADGELFLDALLDRYSRTSYLFAVEM